MSKILSTSFLAPITEARTLELKPRIQAITFRNAGTSTVLFNSGNYSLEPGETLHLSAVDNNDEITVNGIDVSFDTSVGNANKLQVLILISKATQC